MRNIAVTLALVSSGCVVGLVSSGCLVGELEGIPCGNDNECPTNYFCDVLDETCREVNDTQSAPDVQLIGGRVGGTVSLDVTVPLEETSRVTFVLENRGATAATGLRLELAPVSCMTSTLAEPLPQEIPGKSSADVQIDVFASIGCGDPIIVDWFAFFSGRASRGTFALFIDEG